jgi:hypothetical protein
MGWSDTSPVSAEVVNNDIFGQFAMQSFPNPPMGFVLYALVLELTITACITPASPNPTFALHLNMALEPC